LVIKKKKKINGVEWLNSNLTTEIEFNKLIEHIDIYDEDIQYLLNNSFYDTLNEIFSKNNDLSCNDYIKNVKGNR
jgi:transcription elongation factor Elf1